MSSTVSGLDRLSENANPKKLYIDSKGLMTRKFAEMPIRGQPVNMIHNIAVPFISQARYYLDKILQTFSFAMLIHKVPLLEN